MSTARPEILSKGCPFHGANGIAFGPDGLLYAASVANAHIVALDPRTGEVVHRYGLEDGLAGVDDLAFGPDGTLYWADFAGGYVGKRTVDGAVSTLGTVGMGVDAICVSPDGRVFSGQCFAGRKFYEFDPAGLEEPRLLVDPGPRGDFNGTAWGADGKIYGPQWFLGNVSTIDPESGAIEVVASGFGTPTAVKFDSRGRLHVLDQLTGEVFRLDLATGDRTVVGRTAQGVDNLAFDADDRLYVSSADDGFIVEVLSPDVNRTVVPGGICAPCGLTFVPETGTLFLADGFALREFDPDTGAELSVARTVLGFTELGGVMSAQWDGEHLLLASWSDGVVKIWDAARQVAVSVIDDLKAPIDAAPFGDAVAVTEYGTGSVLLIDPANPAERTVLASGLREPAGLASRGGSLYVTDRATGTVLQVAADGTPLAEPRVLASDLVGPEGIAACDSLYVVEADAGRVVRIDPGAGTVAVVVEGLEPTVPALGPIPSTFMFNGIAIDETGDRRRLFVTGDRSNQIYRIEL